jgi:hypothetical protein
MKVYVVMSWDGETNSLVHVYKSRAKAEKRARMLEGRAYNPYDERFSVYEKVLIE